MAKKQSSNSQQSSMKTLALLAIFAVSAPLMAIAVVYTNNSLGSNAAFHGQTQISPQNVSPIDQPVSPGNGAPSGSHYNLNIIGVPKGKTADMSGNSGHRIFTPLSGGCKINLSQGDFSVLDANCADGSAAFQLPNPDPNNDGVTEYSVWARALGKPGGSSKTTTCATDPTTGETYCSIYSMVMVREKGKSTFTNVSRDLLYVYADIDGDGIVDRLPLFDDRLKDYYWNYDNNGLKLVQLRFYQVSTTVN